jgi:MYXO-CTERM domain-containing protein
MNAIQGTQVVCAEAAQCACQDCPQQLEDCRIIPSCDDLLDCMVREGCAGVECDTPERCGDVIERSGGISGPAFRGAVAAQTCAGFAECSLDCPDVDAGAEPDAGEPVDVCTPREEEECTCSDDGGVDGVRICKDDGSGYGSCVCVGDEDDDESSPSDGGCSCRTAGGTSPGAPVGALLGGLLLAGYAVRRRTGYDTRTGR